MDKCSDGIRLSDKEYNEILKRYGEMAVDAGNIREIVKVAKLELDMVCTGVTSMDRPKELCYKDEYSNVSKAMRLLESADKLRRELSKRTK